MDEKQNKPRGRRPGSTKQKVPVIYVRSDRPLYNKAAAECKRRKISLSKYVMELIAKDTGGDT